MNKHKLPDLSENLRKRIQMVRRDLSNLLFHFTRAPEQPTKVKKGVYGFEMTLDSAHSVLLQILHEGKLRGTSTYIKSNENCVCFTEAPIVEMSSIFLLNEIASSKEERPRYEPYGVAVTKEWLFKQGGRPVIYDQPEGYDKLSNELKYRFVPYNPEEGLDYTYEREWRIKTDVLQLDHKNTLVIVPTADEAFDTFYQFAQIVPNTVNVDVDGPYVEDYCHDPKWLVVSLDLLGVTS